MLGEPLDESGEEDEKQSYVHKKPLDSLRVHQHFEKIGHSTDTDMLVSLLKFADSKRYNLPLTQVDLVSSSRNKRQLSESHSNDNFKQTDIRNMFCKPKSISTDHATTNEEHFQSSSEDSVSKKQRDTLTHELLSEISSYTILSLSRIEDCAFCKKTSLCCHQLNKPDPINADLSNWVQPDLKAIENLDKMDFDKFLWELESKETSRLLNDDDLCALKNMMDDDDDAMMLCFDDTPKKENTFHFEPPKSIKKVLGGRELSIEGEGNNFGKKCTEKEVLDVWEKENYGDMANIALNDIPEIIVSKDTTNTLNTPRVISSVITNDSLSLSDSSPIINSFAIRTQNNVSNDLNNKQETCDIQKRSLKEKLLSVSKSSFYVSKKQKPETIENIKSDNSNCSEDLFPSPSSNSRKSNLNLNIEDVCDLSFLNNSEKSEEKKSPNVEIRDKEDLNIQSLCDLSFFGLSQTLFEQSSKKAPEKNKTTTSDLNKSPEYVDLTKDESPLGKENVDSDRSLSPDYGFGITQKKKLTPKNKRVEETKLTLNDVCDPSIFDSLLDDKSLSPVLSQKFRKPNLLQMKSQGVKRKINFPDNNKTKAKIYPEQNNTGASKTQKMIDSLDDDQAFEETPIKAIKTPTRKLRKSNENTPTNKSFAFSNSDDEFQPSERSFSRKKNLSLKQDDSTINKKQIKRKKKKKNPFIDDEAVLSSDEYATEDDSETDCSQDVGDLSFVTQADVTNTTQTHVEYIKSVKSPLRTKGFKIFSHPGKDITNIYSQAVSFTDNTYLEDSFCVNGGESQITFVDELSELEVAEKVLKERRKQKREMKNTLNYKKRRRVITISSDSD